MGDLVDAIDASPLKDNVAILVHGSNGEGFGEHDVKGHGKELYEEMVRVPLVVVAPGAKAGAEVTGRAVSTLDLVPTMLELAGAPAPSVGVSLSPALGGGQLERAPVQLRNAKRAAVIDYPMKLIVVRRDKKERVLLFDLAQDPREERDLSADRPDDLKRLRALIEADPAPKKD